MKCRLSWCSRAATLAYPAEGVTVPLCLGDYATCRDSPEWVRVKLGGDIGRAALMSWLATQEGEHAYELTKAAAVDKAAKAAKGA